MRRRQAGCVLLLGGLSLFALGLWGLWLDVAWIAQPFYAYAWWSYILMLDGFCALRRGHSLLTARRRFLLPMGLWSVTFWFFFELLNLRFQNWYYVGVFEAATLLSFLAGGLFTVLCFATVFTGIFETHEALTAAGLFRRWRGAPGKLPRWVSYAAQGVGAIMAALAILFPCHLAPLIWGSITFLLDPWNYRRGARSVLRDFEARRWGQVARLFLAGLACGLVWESLNFFAPQKWIYTVRGLEALKLFEMPLLGFLGFPALAFDCLAAYSLLASLFLREPTWEDPGDLAYALPAPRPLPRRIFWSAVPLQVAFWVLVSSRLMEVNVGSVELRLTDLSLRPEERAALEVLNIRRPRQLLRVARGPEGRTGLARGLAWNEDRLEAVLAEAELFTFKGIGARFGRLLAAAGVRRVEDLKEWRAEDLHEHLEEAARSRRMRPPRLDMVRVWVLASRSRGIFMRALATQEPAREGLEDGEVGRELVPGAFDTASSQPP